MQYKVSIITVCLNSDKTLEQTINSVINQTYKNIEYIIVDGKSTDDTLKIIRKYENYIQKWVSEPDRGIYDAMNKGITMASGDIIGIINSDDWYDLNTIEKIVQIFSQDKAEVVYGKQKMIHLDGKISETENGPIEQIVYRMPIPHSTAFVKSEVYKKVGNFNLQFPIAADYELYLRMYKKHIVMQQIDSVLAYFREGGVSTRDGVELAKEIREISIHYAMESKDEKLLTIIDKYYHTRLKSVYVKEKQIELLNMNRSMICEILHDYFDKKAELYIFGAGSIGMECLSFFQHFHIKVKGFIDNAENKIEFMSLPVLRPSRYVGQDKYILIASMNFEDEIKVQLEELGYQDEKDFCTYSELFEHLEKRCRGEEIEKSLSMGNGEIC